MTETSVIPSFTKAILTALPRLGVHLPADLERRIQAAHADQRLPMALQNEFWQAVVDREPDPAIGLAIGSALQPAHYDLVGFLVMSSPSLADAADGLVSYSALIGEGGQFYRQHRDGTWRLTYQADFRIARAHRQNAILAAIMQGSRWLVGQDLAPVAVGFEFEPPANLEAYRNCFGDARLDFRQDAAYIEILDTDWQRPISSGSETVQHQMRDLAQQQLQRIHPGTVVDEVRQLLRQKPALGRAQVAHLLAVSERHLTRKLHDHNTSYRELADDVRRERALDRLADPRLTQEALASYLGYSDASALAKAFRRWTGMSMQAYRRRQGMR